MSPAAIRYRRVGLRIERVEGARIELAGELALLSRDAGAAAAQAVALRARINALLRSARANMARYRAATVPGDAIGDLVTGVTGEDVARARGLVGITQRALADELRLHRSTIAEAERGTRSPHWRLAAWASNRLQTAEPKTEATA